MGATAWCRTACYLKLSGAGHGPMLCPKSDHHLNALRLGNRTKRPTAQTRHPGQWLVPRTRRGNTVAPSSNGRLHYLKFSAGVVATGQQSPRPYTTPRRPSADDPVTTHFTPQCLPPLPTTLAVSYTSDRGFEYMRHLGTRILL